MQAARHYSRFEIDNSPSTFQKPRLLAGTIALSASRSSLAGHQIRDRRSGAIRSARAVEPTG